MKQMLKVVSCEEAEKIIKEKTVGINVGTEAVSLLECLGRVTAKEIISSENIPSFDRSTVDGYAVSAKDTYGSGESIPVILKVSGEILMGEKADITIESGECTKISTGGMLPSGADSVVMVENTELSLDGDCLVMGAVSPFQNVTRAGDDVKTDEILIDKETRLTSGHIGVLAAVGKTEVDVIKKPVIGIISSGDEIIPINQTPSVGQVRDINSHILAALMKENGCEAKLYGVASDDEKSFLTLVEKASDECDVVLISGGSSAGTRDMTVRTLEHLGKVYFHGIAIKPGKPTIFSTLKSKPVFGLPGHPAAAYFTSIMFVLPMIDDLYHCCRKRLTKKAVINENVSSNHGRQEIISVRLDGDVAQPVLRKSGVVSLLSQTDGYIIIDRNKEGLKSGEEVTVNLFN